MDFLKRMRRNKLFKLGPMRDSNTHNKSYACFTVLMRIITSITSNHADFYHCCTKGQA
jgi:hypothetical protein